MKIIDKHIPDSEHTEKTGRKPYVAARLELILYDRTDIICTSGENVDPDQGGWMSASLWTPET